MNANELAEDLEGARLVILKLNEMLRQQQNEIEDLINAHRFVQNFAEEQHQRAVALESELDRAVELYTDKAIENETLKKSHIELERGIVKDLNQRQMKNEPVAWMMKSNDPDYVSDYIMFKTPKRKDKISHHAIPLYTHPVKELTDEEIEGWIVAWAKDLYGTLYVDPTDHQRIMAIKMARAILRKAQEK